MAVCDTARRSHGISEKQELEHFSGKRFVTIANQRNYDPETAETVIALFEKQDNERAWKALEALSRREPLIPSPGCVRGWIYGRKNAPPIPEFADAYFEVSRARFAELIQRLPRLFDALDDEDITREQVTAKKVQVDIIMKLLAMQAKVQVKDSAAKLENMLKAVAEKVASGEGITDEEAENVISLSSSPSAMSPGQFAMRS